MSEWNIKAVILSLKKFLLYLGNEILQNQVEENLKAYVVNDPITKKDYSMRKTYLRFPKSTKEKQWLLMNSNSSTCMLWQTHSLYSNGVAKLQVEIVK